MAGICSQCLRITANPTGGRCRNCARNHDRTRRPASHHRYPAEYRTNRQQILAGNPTCHWCEQPATTADHLTPVSQGGNHSLDNLVPACAHCNSSRGACA